ncbi:E3 ubiquitin-protein ligase RNF180 [Nematolebias whitei]|uniref:E3 ubiquitin-protein ligase RNF180 n=1 Tax=Nematolebias whitei TaxID=451745 RepID=UPI00189B2DEA|nr:E3 ubiquitin-protein ligase RNF180 [Nematolebias whitei]
MSSHVGASLVSDSSRTEDSGNEDGAEENRSNETNPLSMKAARPRLRSVDLAGGGRSSNVAQLVRPALLGRKALRKTCMEDNRDRWREGNRERDEETPKAEHLGSREIVKQRKMETVESQEDGAQGTQGSGSGVLFISDIHKTSILEVEEMSNNSQRPNVCPRPKGFSFIQTVTSNLNSQPPRPALPSQRFSSRPVTGDPNHHSLNSYRNPDPFWAEVRTGAASEQTSQNNLSQTQASAVTQSESEDEEDDEEDNAEGDEEEGRGVVEVMGQSLTSPEALPYVHTEERRVMRRERNRIKSLRRRQRRRERWRQSQQQTSRQSSTGNPSSSSSSEDEEAQSPGDREGFICAVCLDVYFSPYMCHPCNHVFCEPCLRTLAKNSPTNTPCPLCRTIITHVFFQKELNQTAKTFFPKEYLSRKQNFQRAPCAKWPLPSCRKLFRIFGGFQRQPSPGGRRQFPHAGGFVLDDLDLEDDPRGWRFDMDMVIIYIYSINWLIGFFIFCFLCYVFFPSF